MKLLALTIVTAILIGLGWFLIGLLGAGPQSALHIDKDTLEKNCIEWVEKRSEDRKEDSLLNIVTYADELKEKKVKQP